MKTNASVALANHDPNAMKDLYLRIYDIVRLVPEGRVTTYGAIARCIGLASSARLVGYALNAVAEDMSIPCHRVVNRNGELTGKRHFATPNLMRELLESENVAFVDDAVDMEKHFWDPDAHAQGTTQAGHVPRPAPFQKR